MKPMGTCVYTPTRDGIRHAFRASGKRHLLITGSRGSGKTTILKELEGDRLPGVTTWAAPCRGVYLKNNRTGETAQVGIYDPAIPGPDRKMRPCPEGFSRWGVNALEDALHAPGDWVSIDELGYLEAQSPEYQQALARLLTGKRLLAAVRRECLSPREDAFTVDLDDPYGNVGCVILASGLGRRFGGNKLMASFRGTPLIAYALEATEGIFSRRVVVTRHREAADYCRERGVEALLHRLPHRSDTVRLGLEALGDVDGCLFCPGDQPLLERQTVAALALWGANAPDAILRPAWAGVPGSPVLFPKWAVPELKALPQGAGGGHLAKKYPHRVALLPLEDGRQLLDVDTREDLSRLQ